MADGFFRRIFTPAFSAIPCRTMDLSDDLILVIDRNDKLVQANKTVCVIFPDRTALFKRGAALKDVLPEINDEILSDPQLQSEVFVNGAVYLVKNRPVRDRRGKFRYRIIYLSDITKQNSLQKQLQKTELEWSEKVRERTEQLEKTNTVLLKEIDDHKMSAKKLNSFLDDKNMLLAEVHHRVKNNLQVIISLFSLQKKYIKDENTMDVFRTAVSRIESMSLIHEQLFQSDNLSNADFGRYIDDLAKILIKSFWTGKYPVIYQKEINNVYLDIDTAITCGLLINELIINILKHAFKPDSRKNEIFISFRSNETGPESEFGTGFGFEIRVKDNGKGMPSGFDVQKSTSFGYKIIRTLVNQLNGTISLKNAGGTEVTINF